MAIALVENVTARSTDSNGFSSGAIDTTGATLLVVAIGNYTGFSVTPTLSDSKGNTWSQLTAKTHGETRSVLYYCASPTVGSGHTFTIAGNSTYAAICVSAFSGAHSSPFDTENGSAWNGTSAQPGSVTPSEDSALVVSGLSLRGLYATGQSASINSGFTISDESLGVDLQSLHCALAYAIQTTATAVNPTWSWGTSDAFATTIAVFKAADTGEVSAMALRIQTEGLYVGSHA